MQIDVTGLHFSGETAQFTGSPSPGLTVSATPTSFTLSPDAHQTVNLSMEAALGSKPGGLYAGVVFKELPPVSRQSATIQAAQARPLIGHVPGATTDSGRISAFTPRKAVEPPDAVEFDLTFLDTGDIDYVLGGTMNLLVAGHQIGIATVPSELVLPENARTIPIRFVGTVPLATLEGDLHLTWGSTLEHSGEARSTVTIGNSPGASHGSEAAKPPQGQRSTTVLIGNSRAHGVTRWVAELLALLLLLLIIALLIWRYIRRRQLERRLRAEAAAQAVGPSP